MKKGFFFFILSFFAINLFSQGIVFSKISDFNAILNLAKSENKNIFIDFYAPGCIPCKAMKDSVFPKKEVGEFYNKNFINLTLNGAAIKNDSLVSSYVIISYPTYIYLNSKGEVMHRGFDKMSAEEFIQLGEKAIDPEHNFKALTEKMRQGVRTPKFLEEYFEYIPYTDTKELLSLEYLKKLNSNQLTSDTAWFFFRDYVTDVNNEPFKYFATHTPDYISKFGINSVKNKMINILSITHNYSKELFETIKKYNPPFYNEVEEKLKNNH